NGVMNVPHDLLLSEIIRTAKRAPCGSPSKSNPSEFTGRPPPGWFALNQPKKIPLDPELEVIVKVPDALSLSFNVRAGILAPKKAGVVARWTSPPISPRPFP